MYTIEMAHLGWVRFKVRDYTAIPIKKMIEMAKKVDLPYYERYGERNYDLHGARFKVDGRDASLTYSGDPDYKCLVIR